MTRSAPRPRAGSKSAQTSLRPHAASRAPTLVESGSCPSLQFAVFVQNLPASHPHQNVYGKLVLVQAGPRNTPSPHSARQYHITFLISPTFC